MSWQLPVSTVGDKMGFDPFVYWEFKQAADNLELAKINVERELIGLPPLMPLLDTSLTLSSLF